MRFRAKKSKATVIGITETKLDGIILTQKFILKATAKVIVRCDREKVVILHVI